MSFSNDDTINEQVEKSLRDKIRKAAEKTFSDQYVETLKDRIVKRTKLGQGVDPRTGNTTRLKPLSTEYKGTRRNNRSRLSGTTQPARSNLTATGQLLDSLRVIKKSIVNGIKYTITIDNKRGRNLDGSNSTVGNRDIARFQRKQGRNFFGFTKPQINQIVREVRQTILKFLK